MPSLTCRLC